MRLKRRILLIPKHISDVAAEIKKIKDILTAAGIPIEKIEDEVICNRDVLWVTAQQERRIKKVLREKIPDIKVLTSEIVPVKLPNAPGEISKIARILTSSNINLKDTHLILKSKKDVLYGLVTNKPRETAKIIARLQMIEKEREKELSS